MFSVGEEVVDVGEKVVVGSAGRRRRGPGGTARVVGAAAVAAALEVDGAGAPEGTAGPVVTPPW